MNKYEKIIKGFLKEADIEVDGERPWDISVHDKRFYKRVLIHGSLGLGESYMDGWWDVEALDEFFNKLIRARIQRKIISPSSILNIFKAILFNMQNKSRSKYVAEEHYDLGNDFYKKMLDDRMQYTCAYWKDTDNLKQAQENKLDLVCRKLDLKKDDTVLELGCGWGGFAKYASEKYGCSVVGYNISSEQVKYAQEKCKGLPVKIIKDDYRHAVGKFDKVVSIGLCEHVGNRNYRNLMQVAHRSLEDGGIFLLHTIGGNISKQTTNPWLNKYIFPGGVVPSLKQLGGAFEGLFIVEDLHNFGLDYDKTLMVWFENFNKNWGQFKEQYGERFYRMWKYYLMTCVGFFRSREGQLWQFVLSKNGVKGEHKTVR